MKRRWIALALLLALAASLTACQVEFIPHGQPENNGGTTIDTPPLPGGDTDPVDVTDPVGGEEDPSGDNTDYTMEKYRRYLEGEWVGVEAEVEGDRYKLADEEMSVTLTFMSADGVTEDGHGTWSMVAWYEYTNSYGDHEKLEGLSVEFHKGPMYYGCANEEWYAELVGGPENTAYTVTVTDNNYLELRRFGEGPHQMWVVYCERAASGGTRINKLFIDRNYYKEKEIT